MEHRSFSCRPAHQILCAPDGRIIVTNTGRNRVQIVHPQVRGLYHEVGLSQARWDRLSPTDVTGDHLNSVFIKDGIPTSSPTGTGLALTSSGSATGDDAPSAEQVGFVTGDTTSSSPRTGRSWAAIRRRAASSNSRPAARFWQSGASVYTRGLAASKELFFVGESEITSRENRTSCPTGVWIVDREDLTTRHYIGSGLTAQCTRSGWSTCRTLPTTAIRS